MSEPIIVKNNKKDEPEDFPNDDDSDDKIHDFPSMFVSLCKSIPLKTSIYLFVLMLVIFSQQFIEHVLLPIGGEDWVDADQPTNVGTIVLCLITSLGYILIHMMVNSSLI